MSIQLKVGTFLGAVLALSLGATTWIQTRQSVDSLRQSSADHLNALHQAHHEQARHVFASLETGAQGSLERGEMGIFSRLLQELSSTPGVEEIGLCDAKGKVKFSSRYETLNQPIESSWFSAATAAPGRVLEEEAGSTVLLARPHLFAPDCLRCHTNARLGELSGVLFVRYSLEELRKAEQRVASAMAAAARKSVTTGLLSGASGLVLASLGVYLLLGRLVRNPLEHLREIMLSMGHGDLIRRSGLRQRDEIGETAGAMDEMADRLHGMFHRLSRASRELQAISAGMEEASRQVDESARIQAEAVDHTASAVQGIEASVETVGGRVDTLAGPVSEGAFSIVKLASQIDTIAVSSAELAESSRRVDVSISGMTAETSQLAQAVFSLKEVAETTAVSVVEMNRAIEDIEQNAKLTAQLSEEAGREAVTGRSAVTAVIGGIDQIRSAFQVASEVIGSLAERARSIGSVLAIIDDITEQTGLLALNASIIAAQAGDHGRGFAVVAHEVRDLSERTSASTHEISAVIRGLEEEAERAVEAMSHSEKIISGGAELASQSGETLDRIVVEVQQAAQRVDEIARATVEQARGSKIIMEAMERLSEMSEQSAKALAHQGEEAVSIRSAAEKMTLLTGQVMEAARAQSDASKSIVGLMSEIDHLTQDMNSACDQQRVDSRRINSAMDGIRSSTASNLKAVTVLNEAVRNLATQIETLRQEVEAFRISDEAR